jgi:hypothetical protein
MAARKLKPRGRPFQKGVSGNPTGLRRHIKTPEERAIDVSVRRYARTFTEEAVDKIVSVMRGEPMAVGVDVKDKPVLAYPTIAQRLEAATHSLDRGHGKPSVEVMSDEQVTVTHDVRDDPMDHIEARIALIRERFRAQGILPPAR